MNEKESVSFLIENAESFAAVAAAYKAAGEHKTPDVIYSLYAYAALLKPEGFSFYTEKGPSSYYDISHVVVGDVDFWIPAPLLTPEAREQASANAIERFSRSSRRTEILFPATVAKFAVLMQGVAPDFLRDALAWALTVVCPNDS